MLTGAFAFSMVGVAYADINNTTFDLSQFSASPTKAGTSKKPKPVTLKLGVKGGTKDGTGQASTSKALKITPPKGLKWNGKAWASSKRCSVSKATQQKTDKVCPKGSKIGSGHVDATALGTKEPIDVTAYVTTSGNLGLFLKADAALDPRHARGQGQGERDQRRHSAADPGAVAERALRHRDAELQPQRQDEGQGQDPRRGRVHRLLGRQVDPGSSRTS